jgi:hypothetical protein
MLSLGFEFAIPAIDRPQTYALERPATVIDYISNLLVSEHTGFHLAEMFSHTFALVCLRIVLLNSQMSLVRTLPFSSQNFRLPV